MRAIEVPAWVTFPKDDWETVTPEEPGLDPEKLQRFLAGIDARGASIRGEFHEGDDWGTVITRGGYLLYAWGDRNYTVPDRLDGQGVPKGHLRPGRARGYGGARRSGQRHLDR